MVHTCRRPSSTSAAFQASLRPALKNENASGAFPPLPAPPAPRAAPPPPCLRCSHCCEGPKSLLALTTGAGGAQTFESI